MTREVIRDIRKFISLWTLWHPFRVNSLPCPAIRNASTLEIVPGCRWDRDRSIGRRSATDRRGAASTPGRNSPVRGGSISPFEAAGDPVEVAWQATLKTFSRFRYVDPEGG